MYNLNISFRKHSNNLLTELSYMHNSDKGAPENSISKLDWNYHIYTDIYFLLFNHKRNCNFNLFELGIGTNDLSVRSNMGLKGTPGASLRMWRDFFNNAQIYGADIDEKILFQEERIRTYFVDQLNIESIKKLWDEFNVKFDIMIDDGLHFFEANINFLQHSYHKLSTNGLYIIEDIKTEEVEKFNAYLNSKNYNYYIFEYDKRNTKLITNFFCVILKSNSTNAI
jgi:hypothetical protein